MLSWALTSNILQKILIQYEIYKAQLPVHGAAKTISPVDHFRAARWIRHSSAQRIADQRIRLMLSPLRPRLGPCCMYGKHACRVDGVFTML